MTAGLELAAAGWSVFPCRESGDRAKSPYTPHGFHDATTDPRTIRGWWQRWPDAMIGAPVPGSVVVLDIDPRHDGTVEALEERLGPLPKTLTAWSGRGDGGRHLYFRRPPGRFAQANLPQGIDLRDAGKAYCIVPPSLHPETSEPYRWQGSETSVLPRDAARALRAPLRSAGPRTVVRRGGPVHVHGLISVLDRHPVQGINNALYWVAAKLAEGGLLDDALRDELAARAVYHGEDELRARKTIASAEKKSGAQ